MSKRIQKMFLAMLALTVVLIAGGCTEKEEAAKKEETKQTTAKEPKSEEQEINDFVLKNTKIVKIFNISQRVNPKTPDLGPFFVVRGIDERGQKSEVWVKNMKIHEMVYSE